MARRASVSMDRPGSEGGPFKGGPLAMMLFLLSTVALAKIEIRAMDHDVQEARDGEKTITPGTTFRGCF